MNTPPPPDRFSSQVPVFHKLFSVYEQWYALAKKFPKQDRFLIGAKVDELLLDSLVLISKASVSSKAEKCLPLEAANRNLDATKVIIRLAFRLGIVTDKQYISLQTDIWEIGKMLGGWLKSLT